MRKKAAKAISLPDRLRDNGAWTGDDGLQVELRLDAAMEIERLSEIIDDAERRLKFRREEIDRLTKVVSQEIARRQRAEDFLRGIAETMEGTRNAAAAGAVHDFLRDTADPEVRWTEA